MSLNPLNIRFRRWQASRRFDRTPRCRTCNNLDYKGHQETNHEENRLRLKFEFPALDRDCPFCGLLVLSIESVVDKDCWKAIIISPQDGKETATTINLDLAKDKPITGTLWFRHRKPNHTRLDVNNKAFLKDFRFILYSVDEVFPPLTRPSIRRQARLIRYRCAQCSPRFLHFHRFKGI